MSARTNLSFILGAEKKRYLQEQQDRGGRAAGFRARIGDLYRDDPDRFNALVFEALMEAATQKWEQQPRKRGPDLFSFGGIVVPEYLTRPVSGYATAEDVEDGEETEETFEKVDQQYATLQDWADDVNVKLRKHAESGAAVAKQARGVDIARRKAGNNMMVRLADIAD